VNLVHDERFYELRLRDGRESLQNRLARKDRCSFRKSVKSPSWLSDMFAITACRPSCRNRHRLDASPRSHARRRRAHRTRGVRNDDRIEPFSPRVEYRGSNADVLRQTANPHPSYTLVPQFRCRSGLVER
jgi:hypothetical protein